MKKLLFVISQFYKGGAETSLLNLLKCLDKQIYEIDLIVLNQSPVKNAVSLIGRVPPEVHVLDAWKEEKNLSFLDKLKAKWLFSDAAVRNNPISALLYAEKRKYDWAFQIGEWSSPEFVAQNVNAAHKCAWIHSDLSAAEYFNAENFFSYDSYFEYYIFVSKNSLSASLTKYSFIKEKSVCIYNIIDVADIRRLMEENVEEDFFERGLPVVLTCANVRPEKNHNRQLTAMAILKERGLDFIWLNIGSTAENDRCQALRMRACELGIGDKFILAGPKENPYKYIKNADAVTVLSDHESWSMVITEAKVVGKPVVATKTSGATEQIADKETGLLTDFTAESIADRLEELLKSDILRDTICENLQNYDNTQDILRSFDELTAREGNPAHADPKELLYIIDDINYLGGAHIATKLQIQALLKQGKRVSVFSGNTPNTKVRNELQGVHFIGWRDFPEDVLYNRRLFSCLFDPNLSRDCKKFKLKLTFESTIRRNQNVFDQLVLPEISKLFSQYETVCVISEGSSFRKYAAESSCKHKVQWLHTDYCVWKDQNDWTKKLTKDDSTLYKEFDRIVVLTPSIKNKFAGLYPHLKDKVVVNPNLMPVEAIRRKAERKRKNNEPLHFITVGRVDYPKAYDRLFEVLMKLYQEGYLFKWIIIGSGDEFDRIYNMFHSSVLRDSVTFMGAMDNPFPYLKNADVFALLSRYEGLPNTIFEALVLGIPVLATDVGGVASQIKDGETGWLVENSAGKIYKKLEYIMTHTEEVAAIKENLKEYNYDNTSILLNAEKILYSWEQGEKEGTNQ